MINTIIFFGHELSSSHWAGSLVHNIYKLEEALFDCEDFNWD
jgi:hypothetical protein